MENLVSIIVPVYNTENYLKDCLNSLLSQTHQNIEILLVNDGSTDGSFQLCREYANKDKRIRLFNKENTGVSDSRNFALERAEGEYVCFVDSDDTVDTDFVAFLLKRMKDNMADISSCGVYFSQNECNTGSEKSFVAEREQLYYLTVENKQFQGYLCNKMFRKDLIGSLRLQKDLKKSEDMVFVASYLKHCLRGSVSESKKYHYVFREGSASRNFGFHYNMVSLLAAYEQLLEIYESESPEDYFRICRNYLKINLNLKGRLKLAGIQDEALHARLEKNIHDYFLPVMREKRIPLKEKANIVTTKLFPVGMLRLKQAVLKREYKEMAQAG